jgi:hypothetical protein
MKITLESQTTKLSQNTDKFTRLVEPQSLKLRVYTDLMPPSQRAGEYVQEWAEKVKTHVAETSGGTAATSMLVKRGPKSNDADGPPSKRPKVELGSSGVEEEVKKSFDKGAVAKVSTDGSILKEGN